MPSGQIYQEAAIMQNREIQINIDKCREIQIESEKEYREIQRNGKEYKEVKRNTKKCAYRKKEIKTHFLNNENTNTKSGKSSYQL